MFYDTGTHEGCPFIEMDLLQGRTLRSVLRARGRLPEREVLDIARQVAGALRCLHTTSISSRTGHTGRGVLHRDIKPENIIVSAENEATVVDFGSAAPIAGPTGAVEDNVLGTLMYMSPEQLRGEDLDVQSDLFSLGTVMYEMITGRHPFAAENIRQSITRIRVGDCAPVRVARPAIRPATADLIDKLMCVDRMFRYSSAREVALEAEHCIRPESFLTRPVRLRMPYPLRRRLPGLAFAFSAAALAMASGVLFAHFAW